MPIVASSSAMAAKPTASIIGVRRWSSDRSIRSVIVRTSKNDNCGSISFSAWRAAEIIDAGSPPVRMRQAKRARRILRVGEVVGADAGAISFDEPLAA